VNNLHIITLYKLHNKQSCESRLSRSSCRTSRARHVERVEPCCSTSSKQQNAWARHVERVESCRIETWRAEWHLGL